jgi:hypothetical protein
MVKEEKTFVHPVGGPNISLIQIDTHIPGPTFLYLANHFSQRLYEL